MADIDPTAVAAAAAARLKITTEEAQPDADSAIAYIKNYCFADPATGELPDTDTQVFKGAVLLTMRMYQDTPNPSGGLSSFDDFTAGGFTPTRLYSHLDQYWLHLAEGSVA